MNTLLAILLYMQLIQSPGHYQQYQIDQLEIQYQVEIQNIMNDPVQMEIVNNQYLIEVPKIIIDYPTETRATETSGYFMCTTDNKCLKNAQ